MEKREERDMILVKEGDNLQEKIAAAAPGEEIALSAGEFRSKVVICTPHLTLRGMGADKTKIIWDDYALKKDGQGRDYNTFRTWTMAVCADDVHLLDLSVENDAGHPEEKGQEVALTVYGDQFQMERCRLTSTQDTLFLGPLPGDLIQRYEGFLPEPLRAGKSCRMTFQDCLIEGTVDFIFGCGAAVFTDCEIRSLLDVRGCGYTAAPAHALTQTDGFTFRNCAFTAAPGVGDGSIYLARPWRDYGLCVFEDCSYGPHIATEGFDKWNDTHRDRTARFYETPLRVGRVTWAREKGGHD